MTIQLVVALRIAGAVQAAGTQVTLSEALEADLIYQGKATRVGAAPDQSGLGVAVSANTNPLTGGVRFSASGKSFPVNGLRTTPVRVATFGDSTAVAGNMQNTPTATSVDSTKVISSTWQSGTKSFNQSLNRYALSLYYPQAYLVAIGAIAGQATTAMVARDTAAYTADRFAVTDVINLAPHVVLLRAGSINDLLTITAGTAAAAIATAYANHVLLINRFLSAGIFVIDEGIWGFTNGSANTVTDQAVTRASLVTLNQMFAAYAATLTGQMEFLDPTNLLCDSTGAYLSGVSTDGTHTNAYGQMQLGKAEALVLSRQFGQSSGERYPGNNIITNALMANASSGTATGFTVAATVASVGNKQIQVIDGKVFQTGDWTMAAGSNVCVINMPFDPSAMAITSGQIFGFEFDVYIKGLNGYIPNLASSSVYGQVRFDDNIGSGAIYVNCLSATDYGSIKDGIIGHVAIPPIKVDDVSANLLTSSRFQVQVLIPTGDAGNVLRVGVANPRIVLLGQAVATI